MDYLLKLNRTLYGLLRKLVPSTFTELILQNDVWLHYNVPIGIGTNPSQLFNAIIDLQWADLWVVSQYCTDRRGCDYHLKYNASKSSTHEPNGTAMHLQFPIWPDLYGYISTDTVTLGESLEVCRQRSHRPTVIGTLGCNMTRPTRTVPTCPCGMKSPGKERDHCNHNDGDGDVADVTHIVQ